ncbi:Hypothetical protein AA314_03490 [Archangium gephyra]|uniref:Uncharacterized protein n=1 Tax=Archangium gephyra TaxID=48 RepID=A0AAC8Q6F7_9BACT|nr:Hypothetical protein AA314_03490 [Archangium gephyra]
MLGSRREQELQLRPQLVRHSPAVIFPYHTHGFALLFS